MSDIKSYINDDIKSIINYLKEFQTFLEDLEDEEALQEIDEIIHYQIQDHIDDLYKIEEIITQKN